MQARADASACKVKSHATARGRICTAACDIVAIARALDCRCQAHALAQALTLLEPGSGRLHAATGAPTCQSEP
ncbi:hypothetical protein ACU16_00590 [Xanthomonas oryzae pv. oryzicola]|nr:hypothetical protein BE73_23770 [Xanthomonas oryzae pv. oryzicola]AKO02390.1 hypothetical protein ACU15_19905 [Xanthomonas oryzae pv. oryzicola]AKO02925.1 hypothetical protein ACU16_00590 [Xanthomonas oryzae pv. oryzicola]AKO06836.1 hypothetical protein ACU17_00600 [Xanthomonas oryzae pv. oryzicola]